MNDLLAIVVVMAQTLSLQEAVDRAIARSPELRALEAAVAEARATADLGDAFRASASLAATPGYATGLPIAILGQVPAIGTIEAHRLLYDRSARAEQIGAAAQVDAALARLESRKREIAQAAADLYARVAADETVATSAQRRVDAYQTIANRTEALRREGRVRDLDVDRAALQVASAKRNLLQAQGRQELNRLRWNVMVGSAESPPIPAERGEGLGVRGDADPEIRLLDSRIEALQHALSLESHLFQPSLAAQLQYSRLFDRFRRYYLNFKPDDFSVGATVTLPIWNGGHRQAASARLTAQLQQLMAQREARSTEIQLASREAESEVAQASAESEVASKGRAIAEESLRIAEQLAREGRGEANDVPLAQIALADADDELADATAHLVSARARLLIVHGKFSGR